MIAASAAAVIVSACSSGGPGVTTGSLFGGGKAKQADPAGERAIQVALTSARATQCGYNFNPAKLKASYLAYEQAQGGSADQIAKLERSYDYTIGSASKKMANPDEYCSDDQTAKIKSDLTRHMAGDFALSQRAQATLLDSFTSGSTTQPWDKQKAFCPNQSCY